MDPLKLLDKEQRNKKYIYIYIYIYIYMCVCARARVCARVCVRVRVCVCGEKEEFPSMFSTNQKQVESTKKNNLVNH